VPERRGRRHEGKIVEQNVVNRRNPWRELKKKGEMQKSATALSFLESCTKIPKGKGPRGSSRLSGEESKTELGCDELQIEGRGKERKKSRAKGASFERGGTVSAD